MVTFCTILLINIAKTLANNKKGKAFKDLYGNLIFIDFIIPGGGRHGACLAKEFREALNTGLGLIILRNFTLGKAVPCQGAFAYIAGVTLQIIRNITSGQARLAALLKGVDRELEGEFF